MIYIVLPFAIFSPVFAASLTMPPPMPAAWPSLDQRLMLTGATLTDPLVTNALAYVQSVVSAATLAIAPSKYISFSTVTYNADPIATCYWPNNLCVRITDTAEYKADIYTCPNRNEWGLTFDDGPSNDDSVNNTPGVVSALASANLKATFFVVGSNAIQYPAQLLATYNAGHQIASHSWTHHPLTSLTNAQIVAEIKYTEAIIYQSIGMVPTHFRPPYGDIDDRVRAILSALGYRNILWTTSPDRDSTDAGQTSTSTTASNQVSAIIAGWFVAQSGFISLQHDISPFTSAIAIKAINSIKATANFPLKPMPVAQCLGDSKPYWSAQVVSSVVASSSVLTSPSPVPSSFVAASPSPIASSIFVASHSPVASSVAVASSSPGASHVTVVSSVPVISSLIASVKSVVAVASSSSVIPAKSVIISVSSPTTVTTDATASPSATADASQFKVNGGSAFIPELLMMLPILALA